MARLYSETLVSQRIDIAANLGKLKTIPMPTDRWIQQIGIDLYGTFTTTDAGFAPQQDNPMGLLRTLQLVGNGGKNKTYNQSYGVDGSHGFSRLYHEDTLEHGTLPPRTVLGSGALTAAAFRASATIDFRLNPRDSDEFVKLLPGGIPTSSLLPAFTFSGLNLNVQIGTHADLRTDAGVNNSFPTATLEVTVRGGHLERGDPEIAPENTLELSSGEIIPSNLAVQDNFDVFPTLGVRARRYLLYTYDTANNIRINDVVKAYRIKQIGREDDDVTWGASQIQDVKDFEIDSQEAGFPFRTGITVEDFDNNRDLAGARDLRGILSKDAFKLRADITTAANRKLVVTEKTVR